jgi:type II secretory pathway predicted ATPase ExeA
MPLSSPPQLGRLSDPAFFFAGPAQNEALARLHFALDHRLALALLTGESGAGKSCLLSRFAHELRATPNCVFQVNLHRLSAEELTLRLASWLGVQAVNEPHRLWLKLTQRLSELQYDRTPLVILADDAHTATPDVRDWLTRLLGALPAERWQLSLILATDEAGLSQWPRTWQDRLDLRVELEPWSLDTIREFIAAAFEQDSAFQPHFTLDALELLAELSGGLPRKLRRLVTLAGLTAQAQRLEQIDAATLQAVEEELCGAN